MRLAPFKDPSWAIWSCSPGAFPVIGQERVTQPHDAHFELHRWEPPVVGDPTRQVTWFSPEYCQWMREFKGWVVTTERIPEIANSRRLPREELEEKYGPYFWTSSLAWMFALALEQPGVTEIAMYGVDMSATEEYKTQRPGCQYFVTLATQRGIIVRVPPESDLLHAQPRYGVDEWSPMNIKLTARMKELHGRVAQAQQRMDHAIREHHFLLGAVDDCQYFINTFANGGDIGKTVRGPPEEIFNTFGVTGPEVAAPVAAAVPLPTSAHKGNGSMPAELGG